MSCCNDALVWLNIFGERIGKAFDYKQAKTRY